MFVIRATYTHAHTGSTTGLRFDRINYLAEFLPISYIADCPLREHPDDGGCCSLSGPAYATLGGVHQARHRSCRQ